MSLVADVSVAKPSKALNIIYLIFGYVVATALLPIRHSVTEQIPIVFAIGSIIATFLFYIKPVDRALALVVYTLAKRQRRGYSLFGDLKTPAAVMTPRHLTSSDVFNSAMIAYEKAKIRGAIFFSIGVVISGRTLDLIGIRPSLIYLIIFSLPTLVVAFWEARALWKKINILTFFYDFMRSGVPPQTCDIIRKAIERKDWVEASIIISNWFSRGATFGQGGLCLSCGSLKSSGNYCEMCGKSLLSRCPNCSSLLVGRMVFPKFCPFCGKRIPKKKGVK